MTQSFCQKCRWQTTPKLANTLDPTSWSWPTRLSRQSVGTCQGNELARNLSPLGNTQLHSSQLTERQWTNSSVKSAISLHELISALKKIEKEKKALVYACWKFWGACLISEIPVNVTNFPSEFAEHDVSALLALPRSHKDSAVFIIVVVVFAILLCCWQEKCHQCCCDVNRSVMQCCCAFDRRSVYSVAVLLT